MKVSRYFRTFYSIETKGYKWDDELDKVIPTIRDNYLEEIDWHWIQHIIDYDTRNKHYRDEDHGGYEINMGSFDIEGILGRSRLMEEGNESLLTMVIQKNCTGTNITERLTLGIDKIEVFIFATDKPHKNKQIKGHAGLTSRHDTTRHIRVFDENRNSTPRRARRKRKESRETGTTLQQ